MTNIEDSKYPTYENLRKIEDILNETNLKLPELLNKTNFEVMGEIEESHVDEEGVRHITKFKLDGISMVPNFDMTVEDKDVTE